MEKIGLRGITDETMAFIERHLREACEEAVNAMTAQELYSLSIKRAMGPISTLTNDERKLEDKIDNAAADKAMLEKGAPVPWEEVKKMMERRPTPEDALRALKTACDMMIAAHLKSRRDTDAARNITEEKGESHE